VNGSAGSELRICKAGVAEFICIEIKAGVAEFICIEIKAPPAAAHGRLRRPDGQPSTSGPG
jgi:hypothetical protein